MNTQVWCLGDVVVDLIEEGSSYYKKCPGGAPANVAVALSRLGVKTGFIGRCGADPMGDYMREVLANEQIATDYLFQDDEHHTSTVLVTLDDTGERSFTFLVNPSADMFLSSDQLPDFVAGQWLQLSSIALAGPVTRQAAKEAMTRTRANQASVFFDVNIRPTLWSSHETMIETIRDVLPLCDVVKVSEEEAQILTGYDDVTLALEQLKTYTDALLVVTLGADGAKAFDKNIALHCSLSKKVNVIDSTGAGDGFVGGMLSVLASTPDWRKQDILEQALARGNQVGSYVVTQRGAMTALPTMTELN
ncbi:aminoimidazole riboside kinase [Celerinatantimonas diazotrophica]|uniref:Fructokinase n=1 Tax=Celerinatantimonas diazotrophica TaxID=412034 RepID=A0A4R1JAB7_9GAMM|nr:aminoimidazole riboside kinase [Celerinatantimonas diazotrophica]TCK47572.1 fructokinase [Celerinatantimonas diazotrophica]CAG9296805.1 Fructokinase [Celerinatantimonas diazotrophica]